ncbi:MAG: hypothetical protein IJ775_02280 [Muribaculaceae bacterium]|nr:hypothetical protein [Muribaculaceae bacterium]
MLLQYILLVLGILALAAAVALLFYPRWVTAAVPAFAGLLLLHWSYFISVPLSTFLFWGVATVIVWGIVRMLPQGEIDGNRASNLFISTSAIAGGLLGMVVDARILVLGVILGTFVGELAYSRTPAGKWLGVASSTFLQYFCAKCLPVVVAVSIIGIAIEGFLL